jgi:4-aminobutyrate aminotransferase-like enzyme
MSNQEIGLTPKRVPHQESKFRKIVTEIPAPGTEAAFADLNRYESRSMHGQLPVIWDMAKGCQVFDRHGNIWIDFTSTIFVANAGHGHPRILEAIRQITDQSLLHSYTFGTDIRIKYLEKLVKFLPQPLDKVFLLSSGTETTECAMKLMRLHGLNSGKKKGGIISFEGAMHGRTLGAVMMGGSDASRAWIGSDDPNIHRFPFPYPWSTEKLSGTELAKRDLTLLQESGLDLSKDICGIMIESYQGWGGVFYPVDYIQTLDNFAKQNNVLMVFDEVQSGFGRTGKLFAYEHYGVKPDIICCGKGMSSGFPLAGVFGRAEIMDLPDIGSMSSTHSANPLACAVGLANLEVMEEENLVAEAARKGKIMFDHLYLLQARFPNHISHILGKGLLAALLVVDPKTRKADGPSATRICELAMQKGLLVVHTGRESIKLGPPLSIPDEALVEGLNVLSEAATEIFSS